MTKSVLNRQRKFYGLSGGRTKFMYKKIFLGVLILACAGAGYGYWFYHNRADIFENQANEDNFSFESVIAQAKAMAALPYKAPDSELPPALKELSYDDHRDIRFVRENGPWYNQRLPYEVQFFHLGNIFQISVPINEVIDGKARPIKYSAAFFDYGKNKLDTKNFANLGYAGFRLHNPLNTTAYFDELVSFLGASYFRGLAKGQHYGLSSRGLAIDTAELSGEEFPVFREFWLEKPRTKDKFIRLYALLDSKSASGAYSFKIIPGTNTVMDVQAVLFPREDIKKLGVAPLTSMFLFGENNKNQFDDYRPEVHDSDGLLIHNGNDEWLWRPLDNSKNLRISSFVDENPKGFGLLQRDRDLAHYLDFEANYQSRPSAWVEPLEGWGKGMVQLVEIPSRQEIHDNIVAYWVPQKSVKAGKEYRFSYRLIWLNEVMKEQKLAAVTATRTGIGGVSGTTDNTEKRKFVIDFSGENLNKNFREQNILPDVSCRSGKITHVNAVYNPVTGGVTVYADYLPKDNADELRIALTQNGKIISEVWSYQWLR